MSASLRTVPRNTDVPPRLRPLDFGQEVGHFNPVDA